MSLVCVMRYIRRCIEMMKPKRAAFYLRVSTGEQTTQNQRRDLEATAASRGWEIVATYADAGISGAKDRDKRRGFDAMLKDATRGKFDVAMAWSVDRLGRSLIDLITGLQELHSAKVDLFLHQQAIDTTTPAGKAMFGMMGVFADFERSIIQARVKAGMDRARAEQGTGVARRDSAGKLLKAIGRPRIAEPVESAIRASLAAGVGIGKTARTVGVGVGTVQRIKRADAA
jgi:DNA invertase Pin-like site-specific DNA recombinase